MGFHKGVAHTFDVWDSEDSFWAFMQERLQPALEQAGVSGLPPQITIYPLHNVWATDLDELRRLSTQESSVAAQRSG